MSKSMQALPDAILDDDDDPAMLQQQQQQRYVVESDFYASQTSESSYNHTYISQHSATAQFPSDCLDSQGSSYQQFPSNLQLDYECQQNNQLSQFNDQSVNRPYVQINDLHNESTEFHQREDAFYQSVQIASADILDSVQGSSESIIQEHERHHYTQEIYDQEENLNPQYMEDSPNRIGYNQVAYSSPTTTLHDNRQSYRTSQQQLCGQNSGYIAQQKQRYVSPLDHSYPGSSSSSDVIFHQSSNYLPIVGLNCTVITTSPSPVEQEVDIYEFSPHENDNQISVGLKTSNLHTISTSTNTPQPYRNHITSGLEEEDDEDDFESVPVNIAAKVTCKNVAEIITSAPLPAVERVRKSRKQQLPPSTKESSAIVVKTPLPVIRRLTKEKSIPNSKLVIKPKKEELPRNIGAEKEAASNAQAQAVQRIATMEGWKRMNEWLKTADRAKNFVRLKNLLGQCLEANITMELLLSNDTPKFVMQLSKNAKDREVMELAWKLVSKWKKVIKAGDPKPMRKEAAVEKSKATKIIDDGSIENGSTKKDFTAPTVLQTASTTTTTTPTFAATVSTKTRPKIAKAKISKPRSTGLEGDDETATQTTATIKRRPIIATANTSLVGDILAASSVPPKIQSRSIMLSDSFMDALEDQAAAPKKPKIMRKKMTSVVSQNNSPTPSSSQKLDGSLYSDTSKNLTTRDDSTLGTNVGGTNENVVAGNTQTFDSGRKRIQFADEKGLNLVEVKYFEIEEGERVNVTKMSSEDMKHFEMQRERTFIREQKGFHFMPTNLPMPQGFVGTNFRQSGFSTTNHPWKLVPIDGTIELIERGINSESKLIEMKRQNTVMEAFYDAFTSLQISEIDDCDYPRIVVDFVPKVIPLEAPNNSPTIESTETTSSGTPTFSTPNSLISQLPLPFSSPSTTNLSHLASKLPPAVAALVSNLSTTTTTTLTTATLSGDLSFPSPILPAADTKEEETDFDFESPASPPLSPSSHVTPRSPDGPDSPDDIDIRNFAANQNNINELEDVDIRCIPSEKQNTPPSSAPDDDLDIRFGLSGDSNTKPTPTTSTSTNANVGVEDVHALMNSLKKSGFMDTANLAGILDKVQNIGALSATSSSSDANTSTNVPNINAPVLTSNEPVLPPPQRHDSGLRPPSIGYRGPPPPPHLMNRFQSSGSGRLPPPSSAQYPPRFGRGLPSQNSGRFPPPPPPSHNISGSRGPRFDPPLSAGSSNATPIRGGPSTSYSAPQPLMSVVTEKPSSSSTSIDMEHRTQSSASFSPTIPHSSHSGEKFSSLDGSSRNNFGNNSFFQDPKHFSEPPEFDEENKDEAFDSFSDQQQIENVADADLMSYAKTFVKQCSYYSNGGCHFGDSCRFAHGHEMTLGIRQAIASLRNRGTFRGSGRGRFGTSGGRTSMNITSRGVEIDYENKFSRSGRGGRRFTSPIRRGYHHSRHTNSKRSRRSRSNSASISPIRSKRRSHSRSRSPRSQHSTSRRHASDRRGGRGTSPLSLLSSTRQNRRSHSGSSSSSSSLSSKTNSSHDNSQHRDGKKRRRSARNANSHSNVSGNVDSQNDETQRNEERTPNVTTRWDDHETSEPSFPGAGENDKIENARYSSSSTTTAAQVDANTEDDDESESEI